MTAQKRGCVYTLDLPLPVLHSDSCRVILYQPVALHHSYHIFQVWIPLKQIYNALVYPGICWGPDYTFRTFFLALAESKKAIFLFISRFSSAVKKVSHVFFPVPVLTLNEKRGNLAWDLYRYSYLAWMTFGEKSWGGGGAAGAGG